MELIEIEIALKYSERSLDIFSKSIIYLVIRVERTV